MVFSDIGHLSGCIEKICFAGRRRGDFLIYRVIASKGLRRGKDRGGRGSSSPFLSPGGKGEILLGGKKERGRPG